MTPSIARSTKTAVYTRLSFRAGAREGLGTRIRRIMSCSLSSDELRDSACTLRYQHAEARAREGHLAVSTRKGCIRSTAYWIRKLVLLFFYRWYLTESGM